MNNSLNFTNETAVIGVSEIVDNVTYYSLEVDLTYINLQLTIISICFLFLVFWKIGGFVWQNWRKE